MTIDRRTFLAAAAATGVVGPTRARDTARGSLADVEHVVILMQENRSFDHYFGTLRGVRGFDDPRPAMLPDGDPVWAQRQDAKDGGDIVRPFRLDTRTTAAGCMKSLDHSWKGSHDRWKNWDVWMPEKGPLSMGYLTREDLPFYYALADQFTICDAYHASIHGPTGPNRLYHFTGSNGLSVGRDGAFCVTNDGVDDNPDADMAKDSASFAGLTWTPYAARLEANGIAWRVYQEYDNFSDNPLGYFAQFRNLDRQSSAYRRARAWVAGSTADNAATARGEHLVAAFARDVAADRLPAVSWIVAPFAMCEHPDAPPAYGETLTARLIAALAANPDVWAKTAFILNYDENDGFFDHVSPPLPATLPGMGASTVDLRGERYRGQPVGLGPRVPLIIVSPWTRGGWVNSQLSDHTSVLRFLERRFGVAEPNISPWRRAICGDLVSMFDFDVTPAERRDTSWLARLPDVGEYIARQDAACRTMPKAKVVLDPPTARQEPGTRPARALPYDLDVEPRWTPSGLALRFVNRGTVGAVFIVDGAAGDGGPRHYTVGAGKALGDRWAIGADERYDLVVTGPNGFYRSFRGVGAEHRIEASATYAGGATQLTVRNRSAVPMSLSVRSRHVPVADRLSLAPGATRAMRYTQAEHGWYDIEILGDDKGAGQRLAGHWENGAPGISEPASRSFA